MSRSADSGERVRAAGGRSVRVRQALVGAVLGLALMGAGADQYLSKAPDVMVLNKDGKKYQSFKFDHKAHAGKKYLPEGDCVTCHHTNKGEKPVACSECHEVGGKAKETKAQSKAVHAKKPEKGHTSCLSCHKAMKAEGKKAPTKCTGCHAKKA